MEQIVDVFRFCRLRVPDHEGIPDFAKLARLTIEAVTECVLGGGLVDQRACAGALVLAGLDGFQACPRIP